MLFVILFIIVILLFLFPINVYSRLKTGTIINVSTTSTVLYASYNFHNCTSYIKEAWKNGFISVSQLIVDNKYVGNGILTIITIKI